MPDKTNKMPPQNIEAEKSLLGCLMIDPQAIIKVADLLSGDDFYQKKHTDIYEAMVELYEKRNSVDVLSVSNRLKEKGKLEPVGGSSYLTFLVNCVPTATHVLDYAKIVREKKVLRDLISASFDIGELGYQEQEDVDILLDKAEQKIFDIAKKSLAQKFVPVGETLEETFKRIDKLSKGDGSLRGIPTGFKALDDKLAGLQKSDLIILAARPSMGKCISKDTEIVSPNPGDICTVEEVFKKKQNKVLSLDKDLKIRVREVTEFIDNGVKPVFKLTTSLGREIETTINHPFLTIEGWKPLFSLKIGGKVATAREIPVFGNRRWPEWKVKTLAYLLAEGGLTNLTPRFTNGNETIIKEFVRSVQKFPNIRVSRERGHSESHVTYSIVSSQERCSEKIKDFAKKLKRAVKAKGITQKNLAKKSGLCYNTISTTLNGHVIPTEESFIKILTTLNLEKKETNHLLREYHKIIPRNSVTKWLKHLGLMGRLTKNKFIPSVVFELNKNNLALFLSRLFACGGSFWESKRGYYRLSYSSSSKKLAQQVQHLLLRFGVIAKLRQKRIKYNGKVKISYEVEVNAAKNLLKFIDQIGIYGKEKKIQEARKKLLNTQCGWTQDTIPREVWNKIIDKKGKRSWASIYREMGLPSCHNMHAFKRCPRRENVVKLANVLNSRELRNIAQSSIYWDKIKSIKYIGKKQVYDLTIPNNHNFVANDFIIHNSAMATDIARYVACEKKIPVGIFSLEMSQDQIIDRLIAAQADIDLWKLRTGRLSDKGEDNDFQRIQKAMDALSGAPIYIDDTALANVLQMRAMARRLKARYGLGLIIVDYLQLMEARDGSQSIVQQVTEHSKGLKTMAKELEVPVLALSQLSRAVETRVPPIPRLSDLRESGCLAGDTLITRADTGERIPIKNLVGQTNIPVHSLDEDWKIKEKKISKVFCSGKKMVYELTLRSGTIIKASANHPFWSINGWTRLDELRVGERILTAGRINLSSPKRSMKDDEIVLLAHLLSDGCILPHQPYHYTSGDYQNIKIVAQKAKKLFGIKPRIVKQKNWWHVYLPSPYPLARRKHHPITNWYQELGLKRLRAHKKEIPQSVFCLDKAGLALFLKHLWATDGSISYKKLKGRKVSGNIYYSSASKKMAEGIKHLLLRFGIRSRILQVSKKQYKPCYDIQVQGKEHQLKFLREIGCFGERAKIIPDLIEGLEKIEANTNLDTWPKTSWEKIISPVRKEKNISWRELSAGIGTAYSGSSLFKSGIGKQRLIRIANFLGSPQLLKMAESPVFWDEIVSIKPLGIQKVYDATVPGTHNFAANDIIVENSLEQDADVVLFIYREDYYKENTERQNIADIIIGKHRNGPTGKVELYFDQTRASFRNLQKGYEDISNTDINTEGVEF